MSYETMQFIVALGGTFYFLAIFILAVAYALKPSKRAAFKDASLIPLKDD